MTLDPFFRSSRKLIWFQCKNRAFLRLYCKLFSRGVLTERERLKFSFASAGPLRQSFVDAKEAQQQTRSRPARAWPRATSQRPPPKFEAAGKVFRDLSALHARKVSEECSHVSLLARRRPAQDHGALQVLPVRAVRQEREVPLPPQGLPLQVRFKFNATANVQRRCQLKWWNTRLLVLKDHEFESHFPLNYQRIE